MGKKQHLSLNYQTSFVHTVSNSKSTESMIKH